MVDGFCWPCADGWVDYFGGLEDVVAVLAVGCDFVGADRGAFVVEDAMLALHFAGVVGQRRYSLLLVVVETGVVFYLVRKNGICLRLLLATCYLFLRDFDHLL